MPDIEIIEDFDESALKEREKGNAFVKDKQYEKAIIAYTQSLEDCETKEAFSNRSLCYYKLGKFDEAIKDASEALRIDPSYIKPYIRRADSYVKLKQYIQALQDYSDALLLKPKNKTVMEKIIATRYERNKELSKKSDDSKQGV
ncbi:hypothetical protein ADUPG1_007886 [Aduncisulcus paluster]|uniref:Uncharacterized protein n=1 Tax=Aduncisulcus paluster TaxID=2918883 RepID=A0ABQ5KPV9_9EUKA|nr:hypothetical protein ADUPG1_007886 [Aduncisulcus paluster]